MVLWWCVIHRCFDDSPASTFFLLCVLIYYSLEMDWDCHYIKKKHILLTGRCILAVVLFVVKLNASRCRQLVVWVIGIHSIEVWLRLGNFSHGSEVCVRIFCEYDWHSYRDPIMSYLNPPPGLLYFVSLKRQAAGLRGVSVVFFGFGGPMAKCQLKWHWEFNSQLENCVLQYDQSWFVYRYRLQ
jgi:hypothetical protein